jgi:hypothetical protein
MMWVRTVLPVMGRLERVAVRKATGSVCAPSSV